MTRAEVIDILRRHQPELQAKGVRHAGLFGSLARGENRPDSDIDILIDLDPNMDAKMGVFEYVGLKLFIEDLFDGPVDVVSSRALKPHIRPSAMADVINAF